jgi:hypothetical protein
VTPSEARKGVWDLRDRLGRNLGIITQAGDGRNFVIHPHADGLPVTQSAVSYASLREAMDGIAGITHGECQLSGDEPRTWR